MSWTQPTTTYNKIVYSTISEGDAFLLESDDFFLLEDGSRLMIKDNSFHKTVKIKEYKIFK